MYSESELILKIRERFRTSDTSVDIGIGDDAAVVSLPTGFSAVLCSDLLAENSHFQRHTHPPESIGYKAIAVNISDIGAMGAIPGQCLVSLAVPTDIEESWIDGLLDGISTACRQFGVQLVGGDSSAAERVFIDVSMLGRVETGKAVRRDGALVGDGVYVTGSLGGSALGLSLIKSVGPTHPAVHRHLYPEPRHQVGRLLASKASAMIDISDGLSVDLAHLLTESSGSARIDADRIPLHAGANLELALHGGEDYELLIAGRDLPSKVGGVAVTQIGEITSGETGRIVLVQDSRERILEPRGWQHFQ
jgi:thiamine-monophosphate kinase